METFYLMVCVAGLIEFKIDDICQTYPLRPQYEMTEDEFQSKLRFICDQSRVIAVGHGGGLTKCELVEPPVDCPNEEKG